MERTVEIQLRELNKVQQPNPDDDELLSIMSQSVAVGDGKDGCDQRPVSLFRSEKDAESESPEFAPVVDGELEAPREAYETSHPILYTPWGAMRKPPKGSPTSIVKAPRSTGRLGPMSKDQLQVIFEKAMAPQSSLEGIPQRVLRDYASEFNLPWRRYIPDSLPNVVLFHAKNILPSILWSGSEEKGGSPSFSPRMREMLESASAPRVEEMERLAAQKTLESYEAFRVVAKRTKNLQVTDGGKGEVNVSVRSAERDAKMARRKVEEASRKERHLSAIEALKSGAVDYKSPEFDYSSLLREEEEKRISAMKSGKLNVPKVEQSPLNETKAERLLRLRKQYHDFKVYSHQLKDEELVRNATVTGERKELPPWEIGSGLRPFNIDTGRFGNPNEGYIEQSDGNVRLMPSHQSLANTYAVDPALLPPEIGSTSFSTKCTGMLIAHAQDSKMKRI